MNYRFASFFIGLSALIASSSAHAQAVSGYVGESPPPARTATEVPPPAKKQVKPSSVGKTAVATPTRKEVQKAPPPSKITQDFFNAYRARNMELAEILVRQGADVNCTNCGQDPLLVWSSYQQFLGNAPPDAISWLLARGANPDLQEPSSGYTPMHRVFWMAMEYSKLGRDFREFDQAIETLLANGARVDVQDADGRTALHMVAKFTNYVSAPEATQFAVRTMRRLVQAGANVNQKDAFGRTPLMHGLKIDFSGSDQCNATLVSSLLDLGSDLRIKDKKGQTAYDIVYDAAVGGAKQCNPLLEVLAQGKNASRVADKQSALKLQPAPAPADLVGEYTGVLRIASPKSMVVAVSGSILSDGSVTLQAPRGFTTVGYLAKADPQSMEFRLRTRAPEGYKFADGQRETAEFAVRGSLVDGVYTGQYVAPTDAGEFVLCANAIAQKQDRCRPSLAESLNSALVGILGVQ